MDTVSYPKLIAQGNELLAIDSFGKYLFGQTCVGRHQDARRLVACWNACRGIPTETLEAGVVVVPANVAKRLWLYAINAAADYFAVASDNKRYDGYRDDKLCEHQQALDDARFLLNVIERFQQSGEQPAETRITVTIDVQTCQGYHDRRVIEVEPGIGWPERMAPEVLKAALEMEERHLNGTVKQNGGEGR